MIFDTQNDHPEAGAQKLVKNAPHPCYIPGFFRAKKFRFEGEISLSCMVVEISLVKLVFESQLLKFGVGNKIMF